MPRGQVAPWYIKLEQFGPPPYYSKALVLCDRDLVPLNITHTDQFLRLRYSVFLLNLPWRSCATCSYPHMASGGQPLIETDSLIDAERVYEGAAVMMFGQITSPAIVHSESWERKNNILRRIE